MRKKIIFLVMALMCLANVSKAESISVAGFSIKDGETVQVALKLNNTHTDLTAFSMTMQLPAGLQLVEVTPTARYQGQVVVGEPDTRERNICGLDLALGSISGTSGDLLILTFTADKTLKTSNVTITDIDFITTDRKHVTVDDVTFTVTSGNSFDYMLGDANGSGNIDVTDVMTIVSYVLNNLGDAPFVFNNADVNQDGTVNVTDAMIIVDMILGRG
ncbi:MAG: hypothetical protein J6Y97_06740 [Prevotella sp.]|nr:hypothetical protein [Prevotella sp.]MBP5507343.1 hypothetical protein [Prevotella sp.]